MGRYLVSLLGSPATSPEARAECENAGPLWEEVLSEYPEVKPLHDYGSMTEGRYVGIFEATIPDRVRELFESFDRKLKASGDFPIMSQGWTSLGIWLIEFESEGTKVLYQAELAKV